jgi:hypothetical protein
MQSVITGAAPHAHHVPFVVDLGGLPTWLAVIGAFAAAGVAWRQLRAQREDIAREARQLERQQADKVDFTWTPAAEVHVMTPRILSDRRTGAVVVVSNSSPRPIRDVTCLIYPDGVGGRVLRPLELGPVYNETELAGFELVLYNPRPQSSWPLMRPEARHGFLFDFTIPGDDAVNPESRIAQPVVRFTDDVGPKWEIDGDLRLKLLVESRSRWKRLSAALSPDPLLERLYLGR